MTDRKMKSEKLQDAIGLVEDKYIEEAHAAGAGKKRTRKVWMGWVAAAACLLLVVVGTIKVVPGLNYKNAMADGGSGVGGTTAPGGATAPGEYYGSVSGKTEEHLGTAKPADGGSGSDADGPVTSEVAGVDIPADMPGDPEDSYNGSMGEAFVLTAAVWNDNDNWPFFTNLVNGGQVVFPSYGIDPRNRIQITTTDDTEAPVEGKKIALTDTNGNIIWQAETDKNGVAYLFYNSGVTPGEILVDGESRGTAAVEVHNSGDSQGGTAAPSQDIRIDVGATGAPKSGVQVMFILDTTGSMGDEIAYLQKDFASIAEATAGDGVTYSVNFYRDEGDDYVTKTNGFTTDVQQIVELLKAEYASGGGDTPEAVHQILTETITVNGDWQEGTRKIAFLIFDAPPHQGNEEELLAAVKAAAEKGIKLVPVVASNAERDTELFGRALAICTGANYVFLTDDSGVGNPHLEPIVGEYTVELLHDIIVREINNLK